MSEEDEWVVTATVRRWQLTETLRQLREQHGWTMDETVERLNRIGGKWSTSKISRIENRQQGVKSFDVERMLDAYEVTDSNTREWVLGLSARAGERGYWLALRKDLPADFHELLNVEAALLAVRQLETIVVPGLLQTPDYTRALVTGANPGLDYEVAERRVLARMARQRVLNRPKPLRYHVIIDETVLTRPIGTPSVLRGQLARLVDAAESEHITLQVLPRSAGATPAVDGPFSILTLPEPIPDVGYAEGQGGSIYIEDRGHVRELLERWGILTQRAMSPARSLDSIRAAGETGG
ncbi:helix-turn-helix domain-containing protein [Actinophytocola algeriensis]|uniref:Transcriptional regulator with XRE-family HTH domain n=1 Tax=Actinophytocola algeriensis TaxID=1768010 RepID=A0A7W7VE86_9PSEU|nr:helix-turn-helix transcriptional regulator [Actinophytocola algeriensis]MBB4907003.1 transcriptional regulator with XRE-family HTH domain [Actinophytocola algeriensis]MBE1478486.1 transcriptional regulator with XRE-family HTH domain [Actinophytocola algeriensis]